MVSTTSIVFPKDVLTPIKGKPSASSLQILQQELYQNARAIPTTLGGGALGHLGLVMTPAEYILRPNAAVFVIPVAHGVLPAQGPGATAAQLFELLICYNAATLRALTSFLVDLNIREGHQGYENVSKCAVPCGYSTLQEDSSEKSTVVKDGKGIQQASTPSATSLSAKQQEQALAAKRQKMAMSIATQPGQQIAMQSFMMYMSGNQLNMFSINVTSMAIISPLTAIFSIDQAFRKVQHDTTTDDANDTLRLPKIIYLALNVVFLCVGLYKMSTGSMRLLPTTSADWISKIQWKEMVESTSIPPDSMIL